MSKMPTFLDHVRNSGLVEVRRLKRLVESLRVRKRIKQAAPADYKSQLEQLKKGETYEKLPQLERYVAREFLRLGWLNAWQISQLIEGRRRFTLGDHLIVDSLGQGGYAHVFLAKSKATSEPVALKVFQSSQSQPEVLTRFLREATLQESILHDHIVRLINCGQDGNVDYLVFEYMAGRDVRRLIRDEVQLPIMQSVRIVIQAAEALAFLHEQGIIHRDVKPANILLTGSGTAKLGDLGLCGFLDDRAEGDPRTGKLVGTSDYMAPDHILQPRKPSRQWDVYSLGCTFYQMVTGIVPFPKEDSREKLVAHLRSPLIDPRVFRGDLPGELAEIIKRMMAKSPSQRFQTMEETLASLKTWCEHRSAELEAAHETPAAEPEHVAVDAKTLRKLRDYYELAWHERRKGDATSDGGSQISDDDPALRNRAVRAVSEALLSDQQACDFVMQPEPAEGILAGEEGFRVDAVDLGAVNDVPLEKGIYEIYGLQKPDEKPRDTFSFELPVDRVDDELPTQFDQKSLYEFVSNFEEEMRGPRWKHDGLSILRRSLPLPLRLRFAKREVVIRRFARQMRGGYVLDPRCGGERSHVKAEPTLGWYVRWLLTVRPYEAYGYDPPPARENGTQENDSQQNGTQENDSRAIVEATEAADGDAEYLRVQLPGRSETVTIEVPPVIGGFEKKIAATVANRRPAKKRGRSPRHFEPLTLIFWLLAMIVAVSCCMVAIALSSGSSSGL